DSDGFVRVRGQTIGENGVPIVAGCLLLYSGHTEVSISPTTFDIPVGGAQEFTATVWDRENHRPLRQGTKISFSATAGRIGGSTEFVLPDTQDDQYTSFTFWLESPPTGGLVLVGPNHARFRRGPAGASPSN